MTQVSKEPGHPPETPASNPALEGVSPASAGVQIGAKVLDAIIVGIPVLVLSVFGLGLFVVFLASLAMAGGAAVDQTSEVIEAQAGPLAAIGVVWLLVAILGQSPPVVRRRHRRIRPHLRNTWPSIPVIAIVRH